MAYSRRGLSGSLNASRSDCYAYQPPQHTQTSLSCHVAWKTYHRCRHRGTRGRLSNIGNIEGFEDCCALGRIAAISLGGRVTSLRTPWSCPNCPYPECSYRCAITATPLHEEHKFLGRLGSLTLRSYRLRKLSLLA